MPLDTLPLENKHQYILLPDSIESTCSDSSRLDRFFLTDVGERLFTKNVSNKTYAVRKEYPRIEGKIIYGGIQAEFWFTPLLFLLFFGYGLIFFRRKKILEQDLKEFFAFSRRTDLFRGESFADSSQARVALETLGIVMISLFLYFLTIDLLGDRIERFYIVLPLFFGFTLLYVLSKVAAVRLICYVFFDRNVSLKWTRTFNSFILFVGIGLIPVILFLSFSPASWYTVMIYVGICLYVGLFVLYLFHLATFFFKSVSSLFYLILYLCSLEVLPAVILYIGLTSVYQWYK